MGVVYEAQDTLLKRHVAIKLLPETLSEHPEALKRFLQEARAAGRLNHPHTVAIHEVDQYQGTYYIVMELVSGGSAQEYLNTRGPFDWPEATRIIADVSRGLIAAHAAGLIHRDIKPSNIMRSTEGIVKLADFGLAKVSDQSSANAVTASGYTVGTPDFMSPEQCRAETLDPRSDVYAVGATYYALLTGKPPFQGSGPLQVMFAHCSNPVPDPRSLNPAIPEIVVAVIRKTMAKYQSERHAGAADLLGDMERVLAKVPAGIVLAPTQWTNVMPEAATIDSSVETPVVPAPHSEATSFLAPAQQAGEIGRLGPYRVLKVLGEGGMGMVFQAEDPSLERLVALKVMKPDRTSNDLARQRFVQEAKAAAAIQHDHIVTIYQVGEDRGVPYLAMQFLQGESLDDRLDRHEAVPAAEIVRIGKEIALGLSAAHERGLIHRDIKPANIWLEGGANGRDRVKILDFGLARSLTGGSQNLTRTGLVMGTPGYMAPEQARGNQPLDHRCDLFSLGCVMYHLCTGQEPFRREDAMSTLLALALEQPPSITDLNPEVPPALADLVMALLAKGPADRPASARHVIEALSELERNWTTAAVASVSAPARVAAGGPVVTAQAKLAAYGLESCDSGTAEAIHSPLEPIQARVTPPAGHPRTGTDDTLDDAPSPRGLSTIRRKMVCPRCGTPMKLSAGRGWCLSCGYDTGEEKVPEPDLEKPVSLTWLYVLLAGSVVVFGGSLAAAMLLPGGMTRVWFSTAEATVGLVLVIAGHAWAFLAVLQDRQDHKIFDYIDPFKLYKYSFEQLEKTRRAMWMGSWGGVAVLCAAFVVGGLTHWISPLKKMARPPEVDTPAEWAAAEEKRAPEAELTPKDDKDPSKEQPFITDCHVIGYTLDEQGNIDMLVLGTRGEDGQWRFAGVVPPDPAVVGDLGELRKELRKAQQVDPVIEGLNLGDKVLWVTPALAFKVKYAEMDAAGKLTDPALTKEAPKDKDPMPKTP